MEVVIRIQVMMVLCVLQMLVGIREDEEGGSYGDSSCSVRSIITLIKIGVAGSYWQLPVFGVGKSL